ncbi:MAG TPA: hypothetical protein VE077_04810 [Candidatus Methylomirabilis sp.]|nr:hypothetical protein [Candidatus Methylomirabilis sp.]
MSSPPGQGASAGSAAPARGSGIFGAMHGFISFLLEEGISAWVHLTGKRIHKGHEPWLAAPLGEKGRIGTSIYERIALAENLGTRMPPSAGLIPDFNALRGPAFDPNTIRAEIRHFYEHAALYHLDVWSEVSLIGRFFLWLLVEFISRRMDQLNFPISSLEVAKGMSSQVVQLVDRQSGVIRYTGWLRRLKSSGRVIYAGLYSTMRVPGEQDPCVKVTFPCRGSANVYLRPVQHPDGSFGLDSSGSAFGRSGFYRIVASGAGHVRVRYVKTLHELFHVYVDAERVLRTDHKISFLGLTILRLHYKMSLLPSAAAENEDTSAVTSASS